MENDIYKEEEWRMYLFTFPYWFIINKDDLHTVETIKIGASKFRFYPPYRSSPANEQFVPQPKTTIFLDGTVRAINPGFRIPTIAVYPLFNDNGIGISGYIAEQTADWSQKARKEMPVDTI